MQIAVEHAGFDDGVAVVRIDLDDAVHAFERSDHAAVHGNGRAGRVRAAAARDQRRSCRATGVDERDDLFVRRGENDGVGLRLLARVVVAVSQAFRGVGRDRDVGGGRPHHEPESGLLGERPRDPHHLVEQLGERDRAVAHAVARRLPDDEPNGPALWDRIWHG